MKKNVSKKVEDAETCCPNCGYCPHCGQSRQAAPWYPYVPYNPPWYVFRAPRVWLVGSTGQPVTLTTTDNTTGITDTII